MRALFFLCVFSCLAADQITTHMLQLDEELIPYTATVGSLPAKNAQGEEKGEIHYIAYVKEGAGRPLTFVFNGGPGSSSVWLHLGTFGPRRVVSPEEGQTPEPPYQIVDNRETILDLTDLVFVDPIGTGMSKAKSPEDAGAFYDSFGDVHSIGDFIRDFLTANKRWGSPLYLAGESYGTFRCCGLADYLQSGRGIYLNGLILISCALDYQAFVFDSDNYLPYSLFLPTFAATAWYHGRYMPGATIEEVAEAGRRFSFETYAPALLRPTQKELCGLYGEIGEITGLPDHAVKRSGGRIGDDTFFLEFFPNEKKTLGRFDTRISGFYTQPNLVSFVQDPSATLVEGIFTGGLYHYLESELGASGVYEILSLEVNSQWKYRSYSYFGYPNFMEGLRKALVANPSLKVFVGMGYFDAATPFAAAEYYFDHLHLPQSFQAHVQKEYYEGGHMYYLNPSARVKFKQDLVRFYGK